MEYVFFEYFVRANIQKIEYVFSAAIWTSVQFVWRHMHIFIYVNTDWSGCKYSYMCIWPWEIFIYSYSWMYLLDVIERSFSEMLQCNTFRYSHIIVHCITYSINTICYTFSFLNMCDSTYSYIWMFECVGGMGHGGGASMRICPMTERWIFSFGNFFVTNCNI